MKTLFEMEISGKSEDMSSCIGQPFYPPGGLFNRNSVLLGSPCYDQLNRIIIVSYFSVGACLNILTFILFFLNHRKERLCTSARVPYTLVMTLCFTDVTFLIAGQTIWAISYFKKAVIAGRNLYLVSVFFLWTCLRFSRYIVVGMSIERFISIKKAFVYENIITLKRVALVMILVLAYSAGIATIELVSLRIYQSPCDGEDGDNTWQQMCDTESTLSTTAATLIYFLDFWTLVENFLLGSILLTCNIIVYRCLLQMKARIDIVCPRNREEYRRMVDMIRGVPAEFSRLMAAIAVMYAFTVIPYGLRFLCNVLGVWPSAVGDYIAVQLYITPPIVNPFLYGMFRRKFRQRCVKLLRRLTQGCISNKVRPADNVTTRTRSDQSEIDDT